ncbi:MAG: S49 family peptidase [Chloroflexota bacterium]|nr:S49 family peptidase [Chloroflexota bacterium]
MSLDDIGQFLQSVPGMLTLLALVGLLLAYALYATVAGPAQKEKLGHALLSGPVTLVGLLILGLALGYGLFLGLGGEPQVAVIRIPFTEIREDTAGSMLQMLRYARDDPSIKAVVIDLNSPGGAATDSEDLFINILHLREKKPVVVSVTSMAASGGYMMAIASDYIYVKGSSFIGNVGVIMFLPGKAGAEEDIIPTGPSKRVGATPRTYIALLEMLKESFVKMVVSQRGDRLKISPQELAEGRIYIGIEAVRLGIADAIGTQEDAVRKAASLAGLRNYRIRDINQALRDKGVYLILGSSQVSPEAKTRYRLEYLYVEPR